MNNSRVKYQLQIKGAGTSGSWGCILILWWNIEWIFRTLEYLEIDLSLNSCWSQAFYYTKSRIITRFAARYFDWKRWCPCQSSPRNFCPRCSTKWRPFAFSTFIKTLSVEKKEKPHYFSDILNLHTVPPSAFHPTALQWSLEGKLGWTNPPWSFLFN